MSLPPVQGSSFPKTISTLSATRSTIEAEIIYDDLLALERAHAERLHIVRTLHSRRPIIGKTKNRRGNNGSIGGEGGAGSDNNITNQAESDLEDNDVAEGGNAMEEDEQGVSEEEEEEEE